MSNRQETQRGTGESNAETAQLQQTVMETGRKAARQFVELPLQQSLQFQRSAAELFVNGLETGNWAQRRGIELTKDTMRNYLQTLDNVVQNAEDLAQTEMAAVQQQGQAMQGGMAPPTPGQQPIGQGMAGQQPMEQGMAGQQPIGQGMAGQQQRGQGMAGQQPIGQGMAGQQPMEQGMAGQQPIGQTPPAQGPITQQPQGVEGVTAPGGQQQGPQPQTGQQRPQGQAFQQPPAQQPPVRPEPEPTQQESLESGRATSRIEERPTGTRGEGAGKTRSESLSESK